MSTEKRIYGIRGIKLSTDPRFEDKKWMPLYAKIKEYGSTFDFFDERNESFTIHGLTNTTVEVIVDGMSDSFFAIGEVFMKLNEDTDIDITVSVPSEEKIYAIVKGIKAILNFDDIKAEDVKTHMFTLYV